MLVQEGVFLQVIRKLDTFRGDSQLSTWLHRVTVNAALAFRQKRANRQKHESRESEDSLEIVPAGSPVKRWNVGPDEPVLAAEQAQIIFRRRLYMAPAAKLADAAVGIEQQMRQHCRCLNILHFVENPPSLNCPRSQLNSTGLAVPPINKNSPTRLCALNHAQHQAIQFQQDPLFKAGLLYPVE